MATPEDIAYDIECDLQDELKHALESNDIAKTAYLMECLAENEALVISKQIKEIMKDKNNV